MPLSFRSIFLTLIAALLINAKVASPAAAADGDEVVVSIKPLHSLVQGVMGDSGEARLLVDSSSVHGYLLKPSQVRAIHEAEVVFYIHPLFETFLPPVLENADAQQAVAAEFPAITLLPLPQGDSHAHEHDEHKDHDEHDEHDEHGDHDEHDDHDARHGHDHGDKDLHLWLDIGNAKAIVKHAAKVLAQRYPHHREQYQQNSAEMLRRLDKLDREIHSLLAPIERQEYVSFHAAYQYLEKRYGLRPAHPLAINPDVPLSAARLAQVKRTIEAHDIDCAFSEPQFSTSAITAIAPDLRLGIADPLGATLAADEEAYFKLMRALAANMRDCLLDD